MNFEDQYLTYVEYKELGGSLEETPFNLLEYEVRKKIDLYTKQRLVGVEEIPQQVKLCEYKMISQIGKYIKADQNDLNLSSETTDGYSVQYAGSQFLETVIAAKDKELNNTMLEYLYGTIINNEHIIYRG